MGVDGATPPGLWERVRKIAAEEVAKFAKSGFLRNARITGGGGLTISGGGGLSIEYGGDFRVRHPNGVEAVYAGDIASATDAYLGTGLLVESTTGGNILEARTDVVSGGTIFRGRDSNADTVISADPAGGLARPYIPSPFARARPGDWTVSSTSAAFETLWRGFIFKQHPRLTVAAFAAMDTSGTTGEVRVLVDGAQLGSVAAVAVASSTPTFGPALVAGEHMQLLDVQIQGRRVSATGAVRVEPVYAYGRQS